MYWNKVKDVYDSVKDEKPSIIFWDTEAKILTEHELLDMIQRKTGFNGTSPSCIIKYLQAGDKLLLITDGQIDQGEVERCEQRLRDKKLENVQVEFVGDKRQMNLSVAASFGKHTEKYTLSVNSELLTSGKTVDLSLYFGRSAGSTEGSVDVVQKFFEDAEQILKDVTMATLAQPNMALRNQLLDLQKHLLHTLAKSGKKEDSVWEALRDTIIMDDVEARKQLKVLIEGNGVSDAKRVENIIREMVKQSEGKNGFSFQLLEPGRLTRSQALQHTTPVDIDESVEIKGTFSCPVYYEDDACCLFIKRGEPIFSGMEKNQLEYYLNMPFALAHNTELIEKLKARLDHPLGLQASRTIFESSPLSPFTRAPVSSALILSTEKEAVKATNFALADLFFGEKLSGLPEFWLYNVYKAVLSLSYLEPIAEQFKSYWVERCKQKQTRITLSGLPIEPMNNVPVDIAVWYCVNSPLIYPNSKVDVNRLRSFGLNSHSLLDMLDILGYKYDKPWSLYYIAKCHMFTKIMNMEKEKKDSFRDQLRAQSQNHIIISDRIVFLDGSVICQQVDLNFSTLALEDYVELYSLIDTTKAPSDIHIPYLRAVNPIKPFATNVWNYGYDRNVEIPCARVAICPETMRPYTYVKYVDLSEDEVSVEKKHWKELSEKMYGPLSGQISLRNYYIKFVSDFRKYPTRDEFILYIYDKERNKEAGKDGEIRARDTLPHMIFQMTKNLIESFDAVTAGVSIDEFLRRAKFSMDKKKRLDLDKSLA